MPLVWLKSEKQIFVVLTINVPQSNANYVTNLIYAKWINMCMDKRNEFGETFVYFSQTKRYLRLSKNLQFLWITLLYVYYFNLFE